jgi:4-hydroxy-tetrahydrodipicolinate reductase
MINLMIHGHTGKLGKRIIDNLDKNLNIKYLGFINTKDENFDYSILKITNNLVIVDVTIDIASKKLLNILLQHKIYVPLIIGTTGNLPINLIEEYSKSAPVAQISNFSDGISSICNILPHITSNIKDAQIKIFETHHIHKKDGPSGTAKTLADKINLDYSNLFFAREGEIYGIHEVIYETPSEIITIKHEVRDPNIFAIGCLNWIEKISKLSNGYYKN